MARSRICDLIVFRPGFSTARGGPTNDLSGRGVGMDVVARTVAELGGRVSVGPRPGGGTRCEALVPVSTLLADVVVCAVGEVTAALRVRDVVALVHLSPDEVEDTPHGAAFRFDGAMRPLADLALLLDQPRDFPTGTLPVLVLQQDEVVGGLAVREVLDQRRAVIHPLGPLARSAGPVHAAVTLEDGGVALVPDARRLLREVSLRSRWTAGDGEAARRSVRILVVDDSDFTRDMLVGLLRDMGHEVSEAANGELGLARHAEVAPQLVFTDLDMPVLDGFGFIEALRARGKNTPVCVISTHREPAYIDRASEVGADAYLVKAEFDDARLSRTIDRLVGQP